MTADTIVKTVTLVKAADRKLAAAQTPGMTREEAINTDTLWVGIARTAPGNISGWHHHGEWNTVAYVIQGACRLEYGANGNEVALAEPGDYLYIPGGVIHRESNPTQGEQALVIVRMGKGQVVFPVDGPLPD